MTERSRRQFIQLATAGTIGGVAGCSTLSPAESTPDSSPAQQSVEGDGQVEGNITDLNGDGIANANIDAIVPGSGSVAETTADQQGRFDIPELSRPAWIRVTASDFIPRTTAVEPGANRHIALTPRDGFASFSFGGDVMFGRRFYEDDDPLEPHFQIRPEERDTAHQSILQYISPLLQDADITSVNLETPLTTTAWRHPSKAYTFTSHPTAATAMEQAGIDYAALANNHAFDALTPGLEETAQALDGVGIETSGAGESSEEAWEPTYIETQGLTAGFISCATITGDQYDIDWAADSGSSTTHSVTADDIPETAATGTLKLSGDVGVAAATETQLTDRVSAASANADIVVVQIHGGNEYQREPTAKIERLTDAAISAGADVVVNHHPHITGGLERRDGALVAWTLGNLVFDQEFWVTFPSNILTVHVTDEGITRAYVDPVLIEGYVPKGIVGKPRKWQLRQTAALSSEQFTLRGGTVEYRAAVDSEVQTETQTLERSGTIYARESGWVNRIIDGDSSIELGRDLLPTGAFDNPDIDDRQHEGALWRFSRGPDSNGPSFGHDESGGVRLSRTADSTQRSILTTAERVPLAGPTTLLGRYRHETDSRLELLVRWYESVGGSEVDSVSVDLDQTAGWGRLEQALERPDGAEYIRFYFRLYPHEKGAERSAQLDDIRLIEWTDAEGGSKSHDYLRLQDTATIEFATNSQSDGGFSWEPIE